MGIDYEAFHIKQYTAAEINIFLSILIFELLEEFDNSKTTRRILIILKCDQNKNSNFLKREIKIKLLS